MERTPVESTSLNSVGYDSETETLEIEFLDGGIYQYTNVPSEVYDKLMKAESMGAFFVDEIREQYPTTKLE